MYSIFIVNGNGYFTSKNVIMILWCNLPVSFTIVCMKMLKM